MVLYSFKLNKKFIFTNLFVALQLSVALILMIITVSSIMSRIDDYLPLRKVLSSQGKCIYVSEVIYINNERYIFTVEDILNTEKNISEIYSGYKTPLVPDGTENYDYSYSYSRNMAELYTPRMLKGKWIDKADENSDILEVVVSNSDNYDLGDMISFYNLNNEEKTYSAKVIGILADDAKILGLEGSNENVLDFRDMYKQMEGECFFFSNEQIDKMRIGSTLYGQMFVTYKNNLNDAELLDLNRSLYKYGSNLGLSDELNINSKNYIKEDIILIFPIALCVLFLVVISEVAAVLIQTKRELKFYAVLNICGATKKHCIIINLLCSLFVSLVGIVIAAAFVVINYKHLLSSFIINLDSVQIFVCLIIVIMNMLLSVIIPYRILSKKAIIETLEK